jgi:hypothetical protein
MTREQWTRELLSLPRQERAALAKTLLASLANERSGESVEKLGDRLEAQLEKWFQGPMVELREELFEEILAEPTREASRDILPCRPAGRHPELIVGRWRAEFASPTVNWMRHKGEHDKKRETRRGPISR